MSNENEDDDFVVVKKPKKFGMLWCATCVGIWTCWNTVSSAVFISRTLITLVYRLTWIHCSLAPVCSPKIVFCASVIVVLACLLSITGLGLHSKNWLSF